MNALDPRQEQFLQAALNNAYVLETADGELTLDLIRNVIAEWRGLAGDQPVLTNPIDGKEVLLQGVPADSRLNLLLYIISRLSVILAVGAQNLKHSPDSLVGFRMADDGVNTTVVEIPIAGDGRQNIMEVCGRPVQTEDSMFPSNQGLRISIDAFPLSPFAKE